jgi:biopolymer transport protein ExbD
VCIEIYARLASATELEISARGLARTESQEGEATTKNDLTYSTTKGTSRAKPALGTLIVCMIQVYLKADSRVPFQQVLTVLDALRGRSVVLLAAPPKNVERKKIVPPYGVKVTVSR